MTKQQLLFIAKLTIVSRIRERVVFTVASTLDHDGVTCMNQVRELYYTLIPFSNLCSCNTSASRKLVSPSETRLKKNRRGREMSYPMAGKGNPNFAPVARAYLRRAVWARSLINADHESLGITGCRAISRYCLTRNHNCGAAFNGAEPGNAARTQVHPQPRNSAQLVELRQPPCAGVSPCDKWRSDLERLSLVGVRVGVHSRKSHYGSTESILLINFCKIGVTTRSREERRTSISRMENEWNVILKLQFSLYSFGTSLINWERNIKF